MIRNVDLLSYIPDFLKEYREMKGLQQALQLPTQMLEDETEVFLNNQFILTADKRGIAVFEQLLDVTPGDDDTLDTRRLRVMTVFYRYIPYTKVTLEKKLEALCGPDRYRLFLDGDSKVCTVRVSLKSKQLLSQVRLLLEDMLPQSLILDLDLSYHQHMFLARMPHFRLHAYSHKQLREMVIELAENGRYEQMTHGQLKRYQQNMLRKGEC